MTNQIKCDAVKYRQGFIEVANVHEGCINLEVWNVHPDINIATAASVVSTSIADVDVIGNTEIELNIEQAKALVQLLEAWIRKAGR